MLQGALGWDFVGIFFCFSLLLASVATHETLQMILIGDGKARGYRMINEKITKLDQLIFLASQAMRTEAAKITKKIKKNNEGWMTIGKKM